MGTEEIRASQQMRVVQIVLLLSCVGVQALVLRAAGPRISANAHVVRAATPTMMPMLPTAVLADAAVGTVDAPIGVIVAGAVLATLTAGLPVYVLPPISR